MYRIDERKPIKFTITKNSIGTITDIIYNVYCTTKTLQSFQRTKLIYTGLITPTANQMNYVVDITDILVDEINSRSFRIDADDKDGIYDDCHILDSISVSVVSGNAFVSSPLESSQVRRYYVNRFNYEYCSNDFYVNFPLKGNDVTGAMYDYHGATIVTQQISDEDRNMIYVPMRLFVDDYGVDYYIKVQVRINSWEVIDYPITQMRVWDNGGNSNDIMIVLDSEKIVTNQDINKIDLRIKHWEFDMTEEEASYTNWQTIAVTPEFYGQDSCKIKYVAKYKGRCGAIYFLPLYGRSVYTQNYKQDTIVNMYNAIVPYQNNVGFTFELNTGYIGDDFYSKFIVENLFASNNIVLYDVKNDANFNVVLDNNEWQDKTYINGKRMINYSFTMKATKSEVIR